jgi:hypothetical protein
VALYPHRSREDASARRRGAAKSNAVNRPPRPVRTIEVPCTTSRCPSAERLAQSFVADGWVPAADAQLAIRGWRDGRCPRCTRAAARDARGS